jgi:uncharacterized protein
VLWVLIGWQFTAAEYVGGILMIAVMTLLLRRFVSPADERAARRHAEAAEAGHHHHHHGSGVAERFIADWRMLWKEITAGFLLAGFAAQLGNGFFASLFLHHAPAPLPALENVLVGPLIAVLSFVCSVGNVPLAAVLWSGGISFAGVLSFLFADLIVLPILVIYRKYYGARFAWRIALVMFLAMVIAALVVSAVFGGLGAIPSGVRPARAQVFGAVAVDYKLVLNVLGAAIFIALLWLGRSGHPADTVGRLANRRIQ